MAVGGLYPARGKPPKGQSWKARFPDHSGKMVQRAIPGHLSRRQAEAHRQRMAAEALDDYRGISSLAQRTTLEAYWRDIFWPKQEAGEVALATALKRQEAWTLHLRPHLGHRKLSELNRITVDAAFAKMTRKDGKQGPLGPATLYGVGRVLTKIVHHAASHGYFGERAAHEVGQRKWVKPFTTPPKPQAEERHGLMGLAEFGALIDAARDIAKQRPHREMFAAAVAIATVCGQRRGEQAPLEMGKHFRETTLPGAPREFEVEVHKTKTGTPRLHPVRGEPARIVAEWVDARAAFLEAHGANSRWLFPVLRRRRHRGRVIAEVGGRRQCSTPGREAYVISDDWWNKLKTAAALPANFRTHDLRGAYAKFTAGYLTPTEVQQNMGHRSFETTQGYLRSTRTVASDKAADIFADVPLRDSSGSRKRKAPLTREQARMLAELPADLLAQLARDRGAM